MHLAVHCLSILAALGFVATTLVAVRRSYAGRDLELHLTAVATSESRAGRASERSSVATAA